jgi:hypothetical protein
MANVLTMRVTSNVNGLSTQLRVVSVERSIFCNSTSSILKTFNRNFRSSGDKDDYSVNISSTTSSYRPLPSPVRGFHLPLFLVGCKFSSTFYNIYFCALFMCAICFSFYSNNFCFPIYFT